MRWAVLAIALVLLALVATLWPGMGVESRPMLLAATAIVLFFSIVPLLLSRRAGGRGEHISKDARRRDR